MENKKDDRYYLNKMVMYIDYIQQYIKTINSDNSSLKPNDQNSDGVIYKFIQLREEAKNLSFDVLNENPILKKNVQSLSAFRNRLTHDYENVSYVFFDEIIEHDLPILKQEIERILEETETN